MSTDDQESLDSNDVKWHTLEHHGVVFAPPYQPLPANVKMKYDGQPLDLPQASEEVAGFFGAILGTDYARDETFKKNFFDDWKAVLAMHPPRDGTKITDLALCDFGPIYEHFEAERTKKKAMTAAEKKEAKKAKDDMEAKYTHCTIDGRKEEVGNFRVELPDLYRGRPHGEHPKRGALKMRVRPEDITINIGEGAPIPVPNMPGTWKAVQNDNTVTWLAMWVENINGFHKYVFPAPGRSLFNEQLKEDCRVVGK